MVRGGVRTTLSKGRVFEAAGKAKLLFDCVVHSAMNAHLHNYGYRLNFVRSPNSPNSPGLFHPLPVPPRYIAPPSNQIVLAQQQLQTGLALASLPIQQQVQFRAQLQEVGRVLMQQRFLQHYSFANSSSYHQVPRNHSAESPTLQSDKVDPVLNDVCADIKEEILKQLNGEYKGQTARDTEVEEDSKTQRSQAVISLSTERGSCSPSICSGKLDISLTAMEPRGQKRHMHTQARPGRKRTKSDSDDLSHQGPNNLPFHWPGPNPKECLERITQSIWRYFDSRHQTQDVYLQKMQLREALYSVMKGVFPYCGLYAVGSSMNGFGNQTSDMDMCLMISQTEVDQKREATEILRCLFKALKKCSFLVNIQLIRAKVPILKFTDRISGIEVDLNINNKVGIQNTHLLNAYARLDWRVAPLVLFVKFWARQQNINDASQGTISSFSLVLMVIHYLQCAVNPPILPSLQQMYPDKFSSRQDVRMLKLNEKLPEYSSNNSSSLAELFVGFLHYYAFKFDFDRTAISVRLGKAVPRHVVVNQSREPNSWKCLCIEEPFDLSNTARSVYDENTFRRCKRVFKASFTQLRQSGDVNRILHNPL